jgi:hypothetical protein
MTDCVIAGEGHHREPQPMEPHMTTQSRTPVNGTLRGDGASIKGLSRFLVVAAVLLAVGITFAPLDRLDRVVTASNALIPHPAVAVPGDPDASVPSASDVLSGYERRDGDDAPTF